jgi:RNA polymerase sigma-70 factor (ECF subfamily)
VDKHEDIHERALNGMSEAVISALRSFYAGRRQQLYTYAVSITHCRESAEDAVHQAFERLLRRGSLPEDPGPYIFRSVRNAAVDAIRRSRRQPGAILADDEADPAYGGPATHLSQDLEEALQGVSPDEREAIVLKIYGSFTFREISEIRGVPLQTVASWYRRGLERIREAMAREAPR